MIKMRLQGDKKILRALDGVNYETKRRILRAGTSAAAKTIRDRAKQLVPVDTGSLRRKIGITRNRARVGSSEVTIGIRPGVVMRYNREPEVYGPFVEYGTVHQRAQPFMRPAYNEKRAEAVALFRDVVWRHIRETVRTGKPNVKTGADNPEATDR